jgi:hypothetical protein
MILKCLVISATMLVGFPHMDTCSSTKPTVCKAAKPCHSCRPVNLNGYALVLRHNSGGAPSLVLFQASSTQRVLASFGGDNSTQCVALPDAEFDRLLKGLQGNFVQVASNHGSAGSGTQFHYSVLGAMRRDIWCDANGSQKLLQEAMGLVKSDTVKAELNRRLLSWRS